MPFTAKIQIRQAQALLRIQSAAERRMIGAVEYLQGNCLSDIANFKYLGPNNIISSLRSRRGCWLWAEDPRIYTYFVTNVSPAQSLCFNSSTAVVILIDPEGIIGQDSRCRRQGVGTTIARICCNQKSSRIMLGSKLMSLCNMQGSCRAIGSVILGLARETEPLDASYGLLCNLLITLDHLVNTWSGSHAKGMQERIVWNFGQSNWESYSLDYINRKHERNAGNSRCQHQTSVRIGAEFHQFRCHSAQTGVSLVQHCSLQDDQTCEQTRAQAVSRPSRLSRWRRETHWLSGSLCMLCYRLLVYMMRNPHADSCHQRTPPTKWGSF